MTPARADLAARCRRIVLIGALGAFLSSLHAQTAPVPAASTTANPDSKSDAIVLNPFQVTTDKDNGYAADSSLAGGRANTPLKLTPASISVRRRS